MSVTSQLSLQRFIGNRSHARVFASSRNKKGFFVVFAVVVAVAVAGWNSNCNLYPGAAAAAAGHLTVISKF